MRGGNNLGELWGAKAEIQKGYVLNRMLKNCFNAADIMVSDREAWDSRLWASFR
jgi:hypothetical protein